MFWLFWLKVIWEIPWRSVAVMRKETDVGKYRENAKSISLRGMFQIYSNIWTAYQSFIKLRSRIKYFYSRLRARLNIPSSLSSFSVVQIFWWRRNIWTKPLKQETLRETLWIFVNVYFRLKSSKETEPRKILGFIYYLQSLQCENSSEIAV